VNVPKKILFYKLQEHYKHCPALATCKSCNRDFTNATLIDHKKECLEKSIHCPYAEFGCTIKCKRKNIEEHLMICEYDKVKKILQKQKADRLEMQKQIDKLERQLHCIYFVWVDNDCKKNYWQYISKHATLNGYNWAISLWQTEKRQETAVGVMPEPPVDLELTWKCTILNSEPSSSITKVLTHTFKENEKKKKGTSISYCMVNTS